MLDILVSHHHLLALRTSIHHGIFLLNEGNKMLPDQDNYEATAGQDTMPGLGNWDSSAIPFHQLALTNTRQYPFPRSRNPLVTPYTRPISHADPSSPDYDTLFAASLKSSHLGGESLHRRRASTAR